MLSEDAIFLAFSNRAEHDDWEACRHWSPYRRENSSQGNSWRPPPPRSPSAPPPPRLYISNTPEIVKAKTYLVRSSIHILVSSPPPLTSTQRTSPVCPAPVHWREVKYELYLLSNMAHFLHALLYILHLCTKVSKLWFWIKYATNMHSAIVLQEYWLIFRL